MQNNNVIEQALSTYKETVSPSKDILIKILNQIPEKEIDNYDDRRAIRSPYMWFAVTKYVALCLIVIAVSPNIMTFYKGEETFASIDNQIDVYEEGINNEDMQNILLNYNNL